MKASEFYDKTMPHELKPKDDLDYVKKQFDYYDLIDFAERYLENYKSRQE